MINVHLRESCLIHCSDGMAVLCSCIEYRVSLGICKSAPFISRHLRGRYDRGSLSVYTSEDCEVAF